MVKGKSLSTDCNLQFGGALCGCKAWIQVPAAERSICVVPRSLGQNLAFSEHLGFSLPVHIEGLLSDEPKAQMIAKF